MRKNALPFRKEHGQQDAETIDLEKQRDRIHRELVESLERNEAEGLEMDRVLQEIRKVADPELGVPRPAAWKAILLRHPRLPLPKEPNLSYRDEWALAKKLKKTGRLKRVRSKYWNPWAKQDAIRESARHKAWEIISAAYDGKLAPEKWKDFRRKHRTWNLPKLPNLTLKQYFEALDKASLMRPSADWNRSLYSLIRWRK